MRNQIEAYDDGRAREREPDGLHSVAAHLVARPVASIACLAQQHRDPHHRCKEDELLAERVEAAIVEHDGRDDVRDVPLLAGDVDEYPAVRAVERTECRQARERPDEQPREPDAGDAEEAESGGAAHLGGLRRSFASADRTTNGKATVDATSAESATSGAWKTTKRTISVSP